MSISENDFGWNACSAAPLKLAVVESSFIALACVVRLMGNDPKRHATKLGIAHMAAPSCMRLTTLVYSNVVRKTKIELS